MSRRKIESLESLRGFANEIAGRAGSRFLLLLDGPMGAGKTQFTKFLIEAIGSSETVSPSFAIHNSYETLRGEVHHFDLFRLENGDDLESTGFWDLFSNEEAWMIIEWSAKLDEFGLSHQLPTTWPKLKLVFETDAHDSDARWIEIKQLS